MLAQIITENGQKKIKPLTADAGAGNPVGTIIPMYKKSNPSGYLYCDGSTFDETAYPLLYAYLGSNVLPDYREFALVGAEQNTTDTIATHDVYTEGEFKDDQLQEHKHMLHRYTLKNGTGSDIIVSDYTSNINDTGTSAYYTYNTANARTGAVTRGKRKAVFFYIKATSGLSENAQDNVVAQLNEERSYSTEEVNTGAKWIDGKPIYRKVIDFGVLPNATSKAVNHNISNIYRMINIRGRSSNGDAVIPIPFSNPNASANEIQIYTTNSQVVIVTGINRTDYVDTYVFLEYTKTTD